MADVLNAVYFRQGLTCTLGLTNNLIDGGQLRAKPHLCKAKANHALKTVFSPRLAVCQVIDYPKILHVRPHQIKCAKKITNLCMNYPITV